jgi:hypothetical protein
MQQLKLAWKDSEEHKILQFTSSGDCLQFTNLFYQPDAGPQGRKPALPDVDDDFASLRMERVNDEEKSLLEKFRSLPKDAQEAFRGTITEEDTGGKGIVLNPVRMNQIQKRSDQKAASDARKSFPEIISASRMPTSPVSKFFDTIVLSDADLATAKTYQKC